MGRVLVIDGPEKAGKTTLCKLLADKLGLMYRHWGPVAHAREFGVALKADIAHDKDWVWDRSWASECVYSKYFSRPSQIADDHWLAEWLYGNAAASWGLRVMLTHPWAPHDETDLPIPQDVESEAFRIYAQYFKWLQPYYGVDYFTQVIREWDQASLDQFWDGVKPPKWVGPYGTKVVVVGEARNDPNGDSPYPGPWSSHYTTRLARTLGFFAFDVGWTNVEEMHPDCLAGKFVAACGKEAYRICSALDGPLDVEEFRHPAWLYRWGGAEREVKHQEAEFVKYVTNGLSVQKTVNFHPDLRG